MNCIAYIDGSSLGNPGQAAYGVVLMDEKDPNHIVDARGIYLGETTNNVAEYHGLLGCLALAEKYNIVKLHVYSDSELLVKQINGVYKVKKPHLQEIYAQIKNQIHLLKLDFTIEHIRREGNKQADRLARTAATQKENIQEYEKRP